jgi:hypothetical protein
LGSHVMMVNVVGVSPTAGFRVSQRPANARNEPSERDVVRLLEARSVLPLVKPAGRDQASPLTSIWVRETRGSLR